jgi:hypothetical protein
VQCFVSKCKQACAGAQVSQVGCAHACVCACAGHGRVSTDCLGLKQDTRHGLSQLQMNVLAGVMFSGCSFLTDITAAPSRSSGRAFAPALWGAVAYLLLGLLPVHLQESWASPFPNAAAQRVTFISLESAPPVTVPTGDAPAGGGRGEGTVEAAAAAAEAAAAMEEVVLADVQQQPVCFVHYADRHFNRPVVGAEADGAVGEAGAGAGVGVGAGAGAAVAVFTS